MVNKPPKSVAASSFQLVDPSAAIKAREIAATIVLFFTFGYSTIESPCSASVFAEPHQD